jgi:hypothetical protein
MSSASSGRYALRALSLILVVMAVALVLSTPAPAAPTFTVYSLPDSTVPAYVEVTNNDARWTIYLRCVPGHPVGPGYISRAYLSDGRRLVDDTAEQDWADASNSDVAIRSPQGIGQMIFHVARAAQNDPLVWVNNVVGAMDAFDRLGNTYHLRGRHCAGNPSYGTNPAAQDPGVNPDTTLTRPMGLPFARTLSDGRVVVEVKVRVAFQEPNFNTVRAPVVREFLVVNYVWWFYDDAVKMWANTIEPCSGPNPFAGTTGTCSPSAGMPSAWIKGPKFVTGLGNPGGLGFTQLRVYNEDGSPSIGPNVCRTRVGNPSSPGRCGDPWRTRLQFANTDTVDDSNPRCTSTQRCFEAVFRSYPPDEPGGYYPLTADDPGITPGRTDATRWEETSVNPNDPTQKLSWWGMDQWAQNMDLQAFQGAVADCPTEDSPIKRDSRMWEFAGTKANFDANLDYKFANGGFFAWRDCVGPNTDPALFRAPDGGNRNFGTYAVYGFSATNNYDARHING